ncbi:deoxyribodipyrimidine photo-lyase [Bacillus fengqiuensis]|nr:deoxyribodipyrimidine photo-lyase [Bacillus fengqiuensis]
MSISIGWQWIAEGGADAAPYFRIFNPTTQAEKFDPAGEYIRKWIPELQSLLDKYIHKPWEAPEYILSSSNIKLGATYPYPIVNHQAALERALHRYKKMNSTD